MCGEDILIPFAVLDIAAQEGKAEPLGQFRHAFRAIGEFPMADHGFNAQGLLHRHHIGSLGLQIGPGALPGIAAIQQQAAPGAFCSDGLDDGRHAIHPTHGPEAPGEVSEIKISQRMGQCRAARKAEFSKEGLSRNVRHPAARFPDADLGRGFTKEHRHQLAVQIRHMDQRNLAKRRKTQ